MTNEEHLEAVRELVAAMSRDEPLSKELSAKRESLFADVLIRVNRYCAARIEDPGQADEVAQDVALTALRRLPTFRNDGQFMSWVLGIARYKVWGERRRPHHFLTDDGVIELADPRLNALQELRAQERNELLREASKALDAEQQEAVVMRYEQGLTQREIGELLGRATGAGGRGILQTCRRKLKKELQRLLDEWMAGRSFLQLSKS